MTDILFPEPCDEGRTHCVHTLQFTLENEPILDAECCWCGTVWKLPGKAHQRKETEDG